MAAVKNKRTHKKLLIGEGVFKLQRLSNNLLEITGNVKGSIGPMNTINTHTQTSDGKVLNNLKERNDYILNILVHILYDFSNTVIKQKKNDFYV